MEGWLSTIVAVGASFFVVLMGLAVHWGINETRSRSHQHQIDALRADLEEKNVDNANALVTAAAMLRSELVAVESRVNGRMDGMSGEVKGHIAEGREVLDRLARLEERSKHIMETLNLD